MAADDDDFKDKASHKTHQKPHSGRKAEKKEQKKNKGKDVDMKEIRKNPKAFGMKSAVKAERQFRRKQDLISKKEHIPLVDRTPVEPPPFVVAVVGPPGVGKTTLIRNLIRNFTRQNLNKIEGPVTVVSSKKRRLTLIECNNDINCMIDIAKVADLALLLIDASFGFEMETFEFLNICQSHGFPRIMGVLTHLDTIKNKERVKKIKKQLKHRFWTEVYNGAKLFYLSGIIRGDYLKNEVHNLARFISVIKFRPLTWRTSHPYCVVDRVEDLTSQELIRQNPKCNRTVCLYGYSRGSFFKRNNDIHILGCGDFTIKDISFIADPCPLPDTEKKKRRSLNEKERLIYAPMSGVGGIIFDKDAVYIDLGGSHSHNVEEEEVETNDFVSTIISSKQTMDQKMAESELKLFSDGVQTDNSSRNRRRVTFADDLDDDAMSQDDDEEEESDEDEGGDFVEDENNGIASDEDESKGIKEKFNFLDSDDDDENDDDQANGALRWKDNLKEKAAFSYYSRLERTDNIQKLVYGDEFDLKSDHYYDDVKELSGGLFHVVKRKQEEMEKMKATLNSIETTKFPVEQLDWTNPDIIDSVKDCFVTGKWEDHVDAKKLLERSMEDEGFDGSDEEMFGDFEDFETGEKHVSEKDKDDQQEKQSKEEEEDDKMKEIMEKKKQLKEAFDREYDNKDSTATSEEKTFYDEVKEKFTRQAQLNKSEFEDLPDELRVQYEGFRPGLYVRIEVEEVPCEFITNFDPKYPIIVGGLLSGESNLSYCQARLKKHRWYKKILKTQDPLIISLGWRRFQTMPLYYVQDHNGRNRQLKYTPQHLHCHGSFWGLTAPQGTGFVAVQSVIGSRKDFRIAATGVILDLDKSVQIVKKLKLIGVPLKIYKKTAFIRGMFNSALEVTKFEGAAIRTVSGLRGQIKKAIRAPEGAFRATFEDRILLSDIVFLRTWYTVTVPKFFAIVCSLLLPADQKGNWQGMKTVGQLRHEHGLHAESAPDSHYKHTTRKQFNFKPLVVPKGLQRDLPYRAKPKLIPKKKNKIQRVTVIKDLEEKESTDLVRMIRAAHREKRKKERDAMVKRVLEHKKKVKGVEERKHHKEMEMKKMVFRKKKQKRGK